MLLSRIGFAQIEQRKVHGNAFSLENAAFSKSCAVVSGQFVYLSADWLANKLS